MREVANDRTNTILAAQHHAAPPGRSLKPMKGAAGQQQPAALGLVKPKIHAPQTDKGQSKGDTQEVPALVGEIHAASTISRSMGGTPHDEPGEGGQGNCDDQTSGAPDLRFT
ncbi:MAG: hypothetical protein KDH09_06090, partial [Chrysiogenetes bacterium]|nr:hypothetical protein [Chrysiogenetes bacterium]